MRYIDISEAKGYLIGLLINNGINESKTKNIMSGFSDFEILEKDNCNYINFFEFRAFLSGIIISLDFDKEYIKSILKIIDLFDIKEF